MASRTKINKVLKRQVLPTPLLEMGPWLKAKMQMVQDLTTQTSTIF